PPQVAHLLRAHVRSSALEPVARLRTDRRRVELRDSDGKRMVEIDDDEVSVLVAGPDGRGRRVAARFRELEVELAGDGAISALEEVVARLRAAGAGAQDSTPKVVRALGPRALAPSDVVAGDVGPKSTAGDVLRAAIASSVARLLEHDPGVRLGDDPEDVHQARVATRRLRSDLRTFRELLDEAWVQPQRDELGWIAGLLGAVRDTDVLLEHLQADAATLDASDAPAGAALLRRLEGERRTARAELLAALDSPRYVTLLDALVDAARAPGFVRPLDPEPVLPVPPEPANASADAPTLSDPGDVPPSPAPPPSPDDAASDVVPVLVARPWRRLRRSVVELGDAPADEALHEVRIASKRCRYAAEAAVPVFGKSAARFADAVAGLQGVLGDLNDAVVAEAWLRDAAGRAPAAQVLVVGELIARQRQKAADCRKQWPSQWKKASAKKLRVWLSGP
ncbi:MAG TPA: CHAD domain-containing protein, partial [Acidimicrobiia bacterium]|nr:CHAD domain-containing protein [Acidimicrobiia bacterium]